MNSTPNNFGLQVLVLFAIFHTVVNKWVVEFVVTELQRAGQARELGTTAQILCNFLLQAGVRLE